MRYLSSPSCFTTLLLTCLIALLLPGLTTATDYAVPPDLTVSPAGLTLAEGDTLTVNNGGTATNAYDVANSGTITNKSGGTISNSGTITNYSTGVLANYGTVSNVSGGVLDSNNVITNHSGGVIANAAGGTIDNTFTFTNAAGGTVTNNGTVTSNGELINAGAITNNGTLSSDGIFTNSGAFLNNGTFTNTCCATITSTGSFTQGASATYGGSGTFILNGLLTNNQSAGSLLISNLEVGASETGTIAGTGITAATSSDVRGTLKYTGSGSLVLGDLLLRGGTLNRGGTGSVSITSVGVASGYTGFISGGAISLSTVDASGTLTIGSVISGPGSLSKTGSGTLVLEGANTYTGTTTINAGTLTVNGSITSPVSILAGSILNGSGTVTGDIANTGVIAPGNSIGTMNITGNYIHGPAATYQVEVNGAGQSDRIAVTGTATLNGGTVSVLAGTGPYRLSTRYTILTAGSVSGTFAGTTSNLSFLTPSLSYDATSVYLTLARNSTSFASVGATDNQRAVASSLDRISIGSTGDMAMVMNSLLSLSDQGARGAYDQIGGLSHAALTGVSFTAFSRYVGAVTNRMGGFFTGGPSFAYGREPVVLASAAGILTGLGREYSRRDFWAEGYGGAGEMRGNDTSSRYDYHTGGIVAGFDREVSAAFLVGVSAAYSRTKVTMRDISDTARMASYQGALYGAWKGGPWYVNGLLAYGYNRYSTSRDISFAGIMRTANGDYGGHMTGASMEAGYLIKADRLHIIPLAGFQASYLARDSFTERDAGALNLDADRDHTSSLVGALGVKVRKEFAVDGGVLTPEVRVKWLHEFVSTGYMLNAALSGYPSSAFTVDGTRPMKDSASLGFGLTGATKKNVSIFLAYDATLSGDRTEHGGAAGVRYRW